MVEFDAIDLVGRNSENGRMICRSPEPSLDNNEEMSSEHGSEGKQDYGKSISYRKR